MAKDMPESVNENLIADLLKKRYILALVLIACLTIFGQVAIQRLLQLHWENTPLINIASRQQVLSQKLTKAAFAIDEILDHCSGNTPPPNIECSRIEAYRDELRRTLRLWRQSQIGLSHGDAELDLPGDNSPEVITLLEHVEPHYRAIQLAADNLLTNLEQSKPDNLYNTIIRPYLMTIAEHEKPYLTGMVGLVSQYEVEAKTRATRIGNISLALASTMLALLLSTAIWLFAPAVRLIREQVTQLGESRSRFRRAVLNAPFPIMIHAEDGEVLQINKAWTQLTGYKLEDIPAVSDWTRQAYGEQAQAVEAGIDKLYSLDEGVSEGDFEITTRDGKMLVWEFSSAPLGKLPDLRRTVISIAVDITSRKRVEEALQHNEARYRLLVETAPHGIQENDTSGTITFSNQAHARMLGCENGELVGTKIWDMSVIDPKELEDYLKTLVREQPVPTPYFGINLTKDGRRINLQVDWNYMRDTQGQLTGFVSIVTNITEQKLAEEQLRMVIEAAPSGMLIMDRQGNISFVNEQMVSLFGYTIEEMIGQPVELLVPDRFRQGHPQKRDVFLSQSNTRLRCAGLDLYGRRKDGTEFPVEIGLSSMLTPQGRVALSSIVDITERKHAEQTLQAAHEELEARVTQRTAELSTTNEFLRKEIFNRERAEESRRLSAAIMDHMAEGVQLTKAQTGEIVFANPRFEQMFGYGPGELNNKPVSILHAHGEKSAANTAAEIIRSLQDTGKWSGEIYNIKKDGTQFWTVAAVSTFDHANYGTVWVAVQQDITERKRIEEQLQLHEAELAHASRLSTIGATVSGLAHELNQPLSAVSTYADACTKMLKSEDNNELLETLGKLAGQAERAGKIIHRVQRFIRNEPPRKSTSDINKLIRETLGLFDGELMPYGIAVVTQLDHALPVILADAIQIQQVLVNLIRNAIDSMKLIDSRSHQLTIKTHTPVDDVVTITIHDTGAGLEPQAANRLFEAFFTTKTNGVGLGLSVSLSIVKAHGGQLWVTPNSDSGTTFHLSLPIG